MTSPLAPFSRACPTADSDISGVRTSMAIKHADASAVEIKIGTVDEGVELSVVDNGRGFVLADHPPDGGIGLASMKERVNGVGIREGAEWSWDQKRVVTEWDQRVC